MAEKNNAKPNHSLEALRKVVDGGYCIGCGLCRYATNGTIPLPFDKHGMYQPILPATTADIPPGQWHAASVACPFTNEGPNEDKIAEMRFPKLPRDPRIGAYQRLLIGHVKDQNLRLKVTSGGIITWMASELLKRGLVDQVIHVKPSTENQEQLFQFGISKTIDDLISGAKSRYYPVQMGDILKHIEGENKRTLLIALPCFLKGFQRLLSVQPRVQNNVPFTVGLICGHLKSKGFAEYLALQLGVPPNELTTVDFRVKNPDSTAEDYSFMAKGRSREMTQQTKSLFGTNWGLDFFRYPACYYCDDVFAECADMTVGDAWLPEYAKDGLGNSVVVSRRELLSEILEEGMKNGELVLNDSNPDEIAKSQAGGLRDRREGLSYRLALKDREGSWRPVKRESAETKHIPWLRKRIYLSRMQIGISTHQLWLKAKQSQDFSLFENTLRAASRRHLRLYRPLSRQIAARLGLGWLKRLMFRAMNR